MYVYLKNWIGLGGWGLALCDKENGIIFGHIIELLHLLSGARAAFS